MVKKLQTIGAKELLDSTFAPQVSLIDDLLYSGIYIFAGPPKTGKSFLVLQIAYHVAMGLPFWGWTTHKKSVVYLALEDVCFRLQKRFAVIAGIESAITDNDLQFCTEEILIADGLAESIEHFIHTHKNIGLIIIDTLKKIRESKTVNCSYSDDYEDIDTLKKISDKYSVCIILVHHTRKSYADDPLDMISGSNGLLGAADGGFVLMKKTRTDNNAILNIVGRDQPSMRLKIEFNPQEQKWEYNGEDFPLETIKSDSLLPLIDEFLTDEWSGTASELISALSLNDMTPIALGRKLNVSISELFNKYKISFKVKRQKERIITLRRIE